MGLEGQGGDESVRTNHVMTKIAFHFLDQPDNRHNGNRFCLVFYQQCFPKNEENSKRIDHGSNQGILRARLMVTLYKGDLDQQYYHLVVCTYVLSFIICYIVHTIYYLGRKLYFDSARPSVPSLFRFLQYNFLSSPDIFSFRYY